MFLSTNLNRQNTFFFQAAALYYILSMAGYTYFDL